MDGRRPYRRVMTESSSPSAADARSSAPDGVAPEVGEPETVTTVELRANLAGVIGRVRFGGRRCVVTVHGQPAVELVPLGAPPGDHPRGLTTPEVVAVRCAVRVAEHGRRAEELLTAMARSFDPAADPAVAASQVTASRVLSAPAARDGG